MNRPQRKKYHAHLWPAACEAQGWDPSDTDRRREVTRYATGLDTSTSLDQNQITALFAYLGHLAGDKTASDTWRRIERQGARAVNLQRQGSHHRQRAGYRAGGRLDLQRFRRLGDDEIAPDMDEREAEQYCHTMRARADAKASKIDQPF